jgi:DNA-binding response OmpR family regulator
MNGFDLCKSLRQNPEFQELPLIFVTSMENEEEKRRGIEAGANAYIVKRDFDQINLLETIRRLLG